jgi:hypothetical protein
MNNNKSLFNCGCMLAVMIFNILVGSWSVDYLLNFFLAKDIPFIGDALIGLIVAEISVPVAVVIWLLQMFGVL